jgi:hypothetical protein
MYDLLALVAFVTLIVLMAVVLYSNRRKHGKIIYYLRSRIAPHAKISNLRFNFEYGSFPIEIGLWGGGKLPYSFGVVLTGKFPKQKMFMIAYPIVAEEVRWTKNKLTTSFPASEVDSEDILHAALIARLELMVDAARELEARTTQ